MKIDQQIESLIDVAGRLIVLMDHEIEILRAMRPAKLEALREEKFNLTSLYEDRYAALAGNKDALALVAPALRREFEDVARRFGDTVMQNGRALTAAKVAHQRMMTAIVEAVTAERAAGQGYSATGGTGDGESGDPVSLSLDCHL